MNCEDEMAAIDTYTHTVKDSDKEMIFDISLLIKGEKEKEKIYEFLKAHKCGKLTLQWGAHSKVLCLNYEEPQDDYEEDHAKDIWPN